MGMTITEKILAAHSGQEEVRPGEFISAKFDLLMVQDARMRDRLVEKFSSIGVSKVFDPGKIAFVIDHLVPVQSYEEARIHKDSREFARSQGITNFFEMGKGVSHVLMPEQGLALPGDIAICGDSHTVTEAMVTASPASLGSSSP